MEKNKKRIRIVVRIEVATLINRDGKINRRKMDRLAMVLSDLNNSGKQIIVVSSGAIVLGSEKLKLPSIPPSKIDMQALAAVGQAELIRSYQRSFDEYGQIVAQVLVTSDIVDYPQRVENTRNTFDMLLSMNIIPIVNENDAVSTTDIELEDNYPLALKIANITGADIIVIKSQENGNYGIVTGNEKPVIQVENEISLQEKIDALFGRNASSAVFPATVVFPATMNEIYSL
ncbi:MAG: glutamate 5-kinase [Bacteroidetes bacterium]|nr:glutamate 5-kinase [Bacteroidota bacterium]